jgi:MFS family permease
MSPIAFVVIITVLNHIAYNGSRVTMALYAIHLHASPFNLGILLALYALLPALLSVAAGRWIDRVGVTPPMLYGAIGLGVGTALPFFWPSLIALHIAACLIGVSFMLITVAAYHAVGALSKPENRPTNFSFLALGFSTSGFIAPILSGLIIDQFGHVYAFLVLACFTLLPIAALGFKLQELPMLGQTSARPANAQVLDLLKDANMRRLFFTMAVLTVSWDVYNFAVPVHGTKIGLSASQIGLVMGSFAAATFVVRFCIPFIAARVAPWTVLTASLIVAAASFFTMPFANTVATMMALMFALGLGLGAPQPMVLTLLHENSPAGRAGEALGLRTTLINASQTVMPLIFGVVGSALGMVPIFFLLGGALSVGAVSAHLQRKKQ